MSTTSTSSSLPRLPADTASLFALNSVFASFFVMGGRSSAHVSCGRSGVKRGGALSGVNGGASSPASPPTTIAPARMALHSQYPVPSRCGQLSRTLLQSAKQVPEFAARMCSCRHARTKVRAHLRCVMGHDPGTGPKLAATVMPWGAVALMVSKRTSLLWRDCTMRGRHLVYTLGAARSEAGLVHELSASTARMTTCDSTRLMLGCFRGLASLELRLRQGGRGLAAAAALLFTP